MELFSANLSLSWLVLGFILLGLELFSGTFVVLFFACGAFLTALIAWMGLVDSLPVQVVIFALLSCGGLFYFRDKLRMAYKARDSELKGDVGTVIYMDSDVAVGAQTEVSYQGARWMAVNESGKPLTKGMPVKVAQIDGIKLVLK
jgi:membrane protein implicated in regulation of membrane protease activity